MAEFTYDALKNKYGDFTVPDCEILIDGVNVDTDDMPIARGRG